LVIPVEQPARWSARVEYCRYGKMRMATPVVADVPDASSQTN
jgi:hypothetical protein